MHQNVKQKFICMFLQHSSNYLKLLTNEIIKGYFLTNLVLLKVSDSFPTRYFWPKLNSQLVLFLHVSN